jgi:prepilin-type N-terminal cleavage/methylation domain-containing protein
MISKHSAPKETIMRLDKLLQRRSEAGAQVSPLVTHPSPLLRRAFTLIELLVVIAIIAVLIALTMAGVQRVRVTAKYALISNEIGQMGAAVAAFQRDKKVDFIPSKIRLRERMDYYIDPGNDPTGFERASLGYLKQAWPHLAAPLVTGVSPYPTGGSIPGVNGLDWNGDGIVGNGYIDLEGDQCLVFFLGGIPRPQGNNVFGAGGFSNNPRNPSDANSLGAPYFEFRTDRLKVSTNAAGQSGFPSYLDPFGAVPYAYYSSYGRKNAYNVATNANADCYTLMNLALSPNFVPYMDTFQAGPPVVYTCFQPTGCQIISAGLDKRFGDGGFLRQGGNLQEPGGDNVANFIGGRLSSY